MTDAPALTIVPTWFGVYLVDRDRVIRSYPFPRASEAIAERRKRRRAGGLAPEEEQLLNEARNQPLQSRDRRFESRGVRILAGPAHAPHPEESGFEASTFRSALLDQGADDLRAAWDPSIHVEEAVRALADMDRALNLIAERLGSWAGRDSLGREPASSENPGPLAEALVAGRWDGSPELPGPDPALAEARQALARVYLEMRTARAALEAGVAAALPQRAANLSRLLGTDLAARMISQARGLDRLARMPASTVQVLGAERAFFEHLRGRAPPPRHGLLFLHPSIQSAPRRQRGKLARALAGKAAIAARLDLNGAPVNPDLLAQFERRASAIRAEKARPKGAPVRRSVPPLHRTSEDG
ncbi:MAG: hypothetical protein L3K17_04810 [Thermoplasmata archaeon]|nr:hypothetical protein [Thermoplasmata archaeon]